MKKIIDISIKELMMIGCILFIVSSCERDFSDDVDFASFSTNGDVFIDNFSPGLNYFPFVDAGADPEAFSVVSDETASGNGAMRFDVPAFGNGFVGATFNTTVNRDLSGFDALTFYAKASKAATINEIGFGLSGETNNKFRVALSGLSVSTRWQKYTIPIPDPSKLIDQTGLFWLAEGASFEGDEGGYVLWFDDVKFEKLGTVAQPAPAIFSGQDLIQGTFTGSIIQASGLTQTFNLESGINQTVEAAPSYFNFTSSDTDVATVNELGEITVIGQGTTTIEALLGGVRAQGSLEITSSGSLTPSPVPMRPSANVKSIFSDAYANDTEINFAPGFGGSTTQAEVIVANGNSVLSYANNNFTGIIFNNPVDASGLGFLHVDVYVQNAGTEVGLQIRDIGANQILETDPNTGLPIADDKDFRFDLTGLAVGQWTSFDIPLGGDLASQKNNLGALILVAGPDFILDNIYFYTE